MSVKPLTCLILHCDEPGCDATCDDSEYESPVHFQTLDGARNRDSWAGCWLTDGDADYCPTHHCARVGHVWGEPWFGKLLPDWPYGLRTCGHCQGSTYVDRKGVPVSDETVDAWREANQDRIDTALAALRAGSNA